MSLTGLKPRCWWGCIPLGISREESHFLAFPPSRDRLLSLAHGPSFLRLQSQQHLPAEPFPHCHLLPSSSTFKDPRDDIGLTQMIQDNLPGIKSPDQQPSLHGQPTFLSAKEGNIFSFLVLGYGHLRVILPITGTSICGLSKVSQALFNSLIHFLTNMDGGLPSFEPSLCSRSGAWILRPYSQQDTTLALRKPIGQNEDGAGLREASRAMCFIF